jgi:hypothetical protein
MRRHLAQQGFGADRGFRWRGGEISRLEGLSDAVFAFAVTLLVVSLEVPETFDELLRVLRGFFAFAVCFSILFWVWYDHYRFFRRYGLARRRHHHPDRRPAVHRAVLRPPDEVPVHDAVRPALRGHDRPGDPAPPGAVADDGLRRGLHRPNAVVGLASILIVA